MNGNKGPKTLTIIALSALLVLAAWLASCLTKVGASDQPEFVQVTYLGEGGDYTVDEGLNFIVKTASGFQFFNMPGPVYNALPKERVWSVLGEFEAPTPDYNVTRVIGPVQKNCVIDYATIDDDDDGRVNTFLLDGVVIHTMPQGMSTRGQFVIPADGTLSYHANDSIGMFLGVCETLATPTPSPSSTPTETPTATSTPATMIAPR